MTHTHEWIITAYDMEEAVICNVKRCHERLNTEEAERRLNTNADLLEALEEIVELMDAVNDGQYAIDSFSTQPAREAIRKAKS